MYRILAHIWGYLASSLIQDVLISTLPRKKPVSALCYGFDRYSELLLLCPELRLDGWKIVSESWGNNVGIISNKNLGHIIRGELPPFTIDITDLYVAMGQNLPYHRVA